MEGQYRRGVVQLPSTRLLSLVTILSTLMVEYSIWIDGYKTRGYIRSRWDTMSKINLAEYRVYSSGKDKTRTRRWTVSTFFGILSGRGEDVVYDASQTALKSALKSYKKKKEKRKSTETTSSSSARSQGWPLLPPLPKHAFLSLVKSCRPYLFFPVKKSSDMYPKIEKATHNFDGMKKFSGRKKKQKTR